MPVLTRIQVAVEADQVLASEGQADHQLIVEAARRAAASVEEKARPALTYRQIEVKGLTGRTLRLEESELRIGPHIHLLRAAEQVLVGVVTLGEAIDEEIRRLEQAGEVLEAYLLGKSAFFALESAAGGLRSLAEETAAGRGWGVSAALSPGALAGWPVTEQANICSLLDLAGIGVVLTESCLFRPYYTLSLLIGLGRGYEAHQVTPTCRYCRLNKTCPYRQISK
ncbi:MAG: hypothetical protein AB1641_31405 [Thermodesulfobacteriota bacterium]